MLLCIADHHEPMHGNASPSVRRDRVERWVREYPECVAGLADSRGRPPQHTFFYPAEEYDPWDVESLAGLCRAGLGDVEVHLHHDDDTADNLRSTLETYKHTLHDEHGLLERDDSGEITYGFVHGNWALNNSRPDGRWCGVDGELAVLKETGCYADFTYPSVPSPTQPRTVNAIYYALDSPFGPRSHESGPRARVGVVAPENGLLMIQGPVGLDWSRRRRGIIPGVENADVRGNQHPSLARLDLWLRAGIGVEGRPEWVFVKLHTHGSPDRDANVLLGEPMRRFHEDLARIAGERTGFHYYYVTAREMARLVHEAEDGARVPFEETADVGRVVSRTGD